MPLLDDFKARFPEIDETTADQFVPIIEPEYRAYYNFEYNDRNKEAILHLIAHFVTIESRDTKGKGGAVQPEASRSADGVSVSFQAPPQMQSEFNRIFSTTRYGQRFLLLIAHRRGGVAV